MGGLGQVMLAKGSGASVNEVLKVLKRAYAKGSRDHLTLRNLAQAYARTGQPGQASVVTAERYALQSLNRRKFMPNAPKANCPVAPLGGSNQKTSSPSLAAWPLKRRKDNQMTQILLKTTALLAALALPAAANDLDKMTTEERTIFREEVRSYLIENPEVLLEAMQVLRDREAQQEANRDEQMLSQLSPEIFNDGVSFVGGNPNGDITIVEFLDYRCGYCRRAHTDMMKLLKADGNVRWIVKEFPILGADSDLASKLAVATLQHYGSDAYFNLHNVLMEFKGPMNNGTLARIAKDAGIELEPIRARMDSKEVSDHIGRMHALGQQLGVTGTPAFVIEDTILRGYLPLADMQNIVEEIRENAG